MVYFTYRNCQDFIPRIPLDMMQPGIALLINSIILISFFMGPNNLSTYTLEETWRQSVDRREEYFNFYELPAK